MLAWASIVPAAHALGLPFVDIPTAGDVASDAMDAASRAIVNLIASSVASLTNEIIKVSDTVAAPQVGVSNAWFTASYKRTVAVSLYLMAIASLVAITAAGIRGKVGDIAQVIFVGIPGSVVAMMVATLGVQLALGLTDAMTAYTFRSSVTDIQTFLHDIGTVFTATDGAAEGTSQLAPGLVLIIGLLLIVAQLVILAVLIVRAALIYIVTLFLPLVFAVQVWPATRHMTRKALELLAVLILSKFAIFTCFALGAGAMSSVLDSAGTTGGPPAVQSAIIGLGVMAAAAFSPMLLMSIVPGIAGSFGAGMPGGATGAGALAVKSPSQIMRSTLSGVHTVRGNGTHTGSSSASSSHGGSTTPRPPNPSGAGSAARGEQAHTSPSTSPGGGPAGASGARGGSPAAASSHPAGAAASGGAHLLTAGAQAAARSAQTTAATRGGSGAATASAGGSSPGPHVVSQRSEPAPNQQPASSNANGQVDPSAPQASSTGGGADRVASRGSQIERPAAPSRGTSSDGFSQVSTRQPFTLETT